MSIRTLVPIFVLLMAAHSSMAQDRAAEEAKAAAIKLEAFEAEALKAQAAAAAVAEETPMKLAKIKPVQGVEFERSYFTLHGSPIGALPEITFEVFGDGTCRFIRETGGQMTLVTEHKLAGERVKRLSDLLAKTDWLTKASSGPRIADGDRFSAKVMQTLEGGVGPAMNFDSGSAEPYQSVRLFVMGLLRQEELYEKVWSGNGVGLDELTRYYSGGKNKPAVEIDLARYRAEMLKVIRDPLDREDKQVATAVRAMEYYQETGERRWVEALANDRSGTVRAAVAETLASFGGAESIAVLRKMAHRTPAAALALVTLGNDAVPAVVEIIAAGKGPEMTSPQVAMIRAYVDNWDKVPQPVDDRVIAAVKSNLAAAKARKDGSEIRYHEMFLERTGASGAKVSN